MSTPVEEHVEEYIRHLEELYALIREWVDSAGFTWEEQATSVHEQLGGRYDAPRLLIRRPDGKPVAELAPIGADIIGAEGRVDLRGPLDSKPILYLSRGGPVLKTSISVSGNKKEEPVRPLFKGVHHEGWYTSEERRPQTVRALKKETFLDLLEKVADYERPQSA